MATNSLSADDLAKLQQWYRQYQAMGTGYGGNQQYAPPGVSAGGMNFGFQGMQHQDEGGSYWTPSSGSVTASDPNDQNYAYDVNPNTGDLQRYLINKGDASFFGGAAKDIGNAAAPLIALYLAGTGLAAAGAGSAGGIGGSGFAAGAGASMSPADAFALSDSVYGGSGLSAGGLGGGGYVDGATLFADPGSVPGLSNSVNGLSSTGGFGGTSAGLGGTGGTDIFGGNGMATGFTDSGTAGGAADAGYVGGTAGLGGQVTGATGVAVPGSSFTSLLGPAASLLGAAVGSKPQTTSESSTRDIPDWLKPYVTGQGGLLPGAQSLFQQQTAPGAMPGYTQMQNVGMGLLSQPIAGNGFNKFYGR